MPGLMPGGAGTAGRVHVVGAGLAGLAAALSLSRAGRAVCVHEAAGQAGGRCRSYHDQALGCRIDNGSHLLLSANHAALDYLREVGAVDSLVGPDQPAFAFLDLAGGSSWAIRPNAGRLGWWILAPGRRVPGSRPLDYLKALRLLAAPPGATVMAVLGPGPLMERFWRPLVVAALNAQPEVAAAGLLLAVLRETFGRGGQGCRPLVARDGLGAAFVEPALATLARRGVEVGFGRRLRAIERQDGRVVALGFPDGPVALGPADSVVLAVPAPVAAALLPGLVVPRGSSAIVNAHFRLDRPARLPGGGPLVGLIGGTVDWVFLRDRLASATVSAADALAEEPAEALLPRLWQDTAAALGWSGAPQPPGRIVKEKRATFLQVPSEVARRPPGRTAWRNLLLAGDWIDTGLPATIEGAIRSGRAAAEAVEALGSSGPSTVKACAATRPPS